jgi:ribA/ribD-fused uncharacterized protein
MAYLLKIRVIVKANGDGAGESPSSCQINHKTVNVSLYCLTTSMYKCSSKTSKIRNKKKMGLLGEDVYVCHPLDLPQSRGVTTMVMKGATMDMDDASIVRTIRELGCRSVCYTWQRGEGTDDGSLVCAWMMGVLTYGYRRNIAPRELSNFLRERIRRGLFDDDVIRHIKTMLTPLDFYGANVGPWSNFSPHRVRSTEFPGKEFWSSEALFQAYKAEDDPSTVDQFVALRSPGAAARLGRSIPLRTDWNDVRVEKMMQTLRDKMDTDPLIREDLKATGIRPLFEHTPRDLYWGDGGGIGRPGQNQLGRCWARLRLEVCVPAMIQVIQCADGSTTTRVIN